KKAQDFEFATAELAAGRSRPMRPRWFGARLRCAAWFESVTEEVEQHPYNPIGILEKEVRAYTVENHQPAMRQGIRERAGDLERGQQRLGLIGAHHIPGSGRASK